MLSYVCEIINTIEVSVNEKGLPHTASAIYNNKLRAIGFHHSVQLVTLVFPAYQSLVFHHS